MHEHKLSEFNPLDLLATAASLQRPGRETTTTASSPSEANPESESAGMRRDTVQRRTTRSASSATIDNAKSKSKKLENDMKIYKVVVKNELSKMLEEHNYGHPKRNFRYILHDEPFSSVEKETDLKLMDSNCNEYRDCLESSSQGDITTEQDSNGIVCDNNCNGLTDKDVDCEQTDNQHVYMENNMDTNECMENCRNADTCASDSRMSVDSPSGEEDYKDVPNCSALELLEPSSKCSGSLICDKGLEEGAKCEGQDDSLPEVRPIDRLESYEDEHSLVDVETVSSGTNKCEEPVCQQEAEEPQDSANTLDGFIVSDLCHSCESADLTETKNSGQSTETETLERDPAQSVQNEQNLGSSSTNSRNDNTTTLALLSAPLLQTPPDTSVQGNVKKQTIIRSLLTGETIVVVQKSPNGSKEVGKIPFLVDSTQMNTGKLVANNPLVFKERSDNSNGKLKASVSDALQQELLKDLPKVNEKITESFKLETLSGSNKKLTELTDIEIARQQNRINSEKLKLSGKGRPETVGVSSPDKPLNSLPQLPLATVVPLSGGQPTKDPAAGMKPSAVHSALLSKLSNGISQPKARVAPVVVNSSRLEQFNIGRFASMSSRKIGLVHVQAVPASGNIKKVPEKAGHIPDCESAAYQQVIKQFPNLAKAYKDDDLLKMAVAPDDILECLPTVKSRIPMEDHIFHDHDYCARGFPARGAASLLPSEGRLLDDIDREPKLGRPPKNVDRRKKAVKRPVEGMGSRASSPAEYTTQTAMASAGDSKTISELRLEVEMKSAQTKRRSSRQKSGRDSSPGENPDSPDIDGQGDGAKIKITGAFQDDFVYFINKTSRNRRRASEQPQIPIAPVIQASDIYIPHLSDADIAALKDRPVMSVTCDDGQTNITDEDSKVINTILSMENSLERTEPATDGFGFPNSGTDALNGLDLTPEQMDILFSAIDGAHSDPSVQKFSQENFGLEPETALAPVPELDPVRELHVDPVPTLTSVPDENLDTVPEKALKVLKVPQTTEAIPSFTDAGAQLLDNVDNIHMPNMDLILSNASSLKSNLPTLDASEVQDSISAITSTSNTTVSLEATMGTMSSSVDSTVLTPQTNQFSVTAVSTEPKPAPLNAMSDISFEKSLDFLGVGDMKADLFPEMGLSQENTATVTTATSTSTTEANSPWIVTVSMYWNDLPAIMLGNQPYVRLVDIYKQILPAKDTGILKKRCQLLGMEVKNCSEMQRYFLVKYGRGYNSKSTLVVSKDDAKRLIGFYVEPQSRMAKVEGPTHKMPGSPLPASKFRKPSSEASCDSTTSGSVSPGIPSYTSSVTAKKDRPKSTSPRTPSKRRVLTMPAGESVSKRLRHKKINFRSMLQGIKREDEVMEGESPLSPATPSDVNLQCEVDKPMDTQLDGQTRRRSRSQSENSEKTSPVNPPSPVVYQNTEKVPPVRHRSYYSRANLKSARPHSMGLLKPCSLRPLNLLGKQLRRVKGSFSNGGTLQNVLKKRQLNGSVPAALETSENNKTGMATLSGVDVKQLRSDMSPLGEECPLQGNTNTMSVNLRRASSRRCAVTSSAVNHRVRSSNRKRKLKQLYPIENYSYTKKVKKEPDTSVCVQSVPIESSRHQRVRSAIPLRTSPRKKRADLTTRVDGDSHVITSSRATSEDEENRPKNVITLTNGPEFETFTALTGDFSM